PAAHQPTAELLFPLPHRLRHPAPLRDRARQAGFHGHAGLAVAHSYVESPNVRSFPRKRTATNSRSSLPGLTRQSINFCKKPLAKKMDARVKPAHDSRFLGNERTKSPSLRRDHAQPFGLALRTSFAAPEPDLHAVEIEIDHRRGVERQELAQREAADHGVAEWLAQLRARAVTEGER